MVEKYFATGRCLCGKLKYTISSPPAWMSQCHCDDCRRFSGAGHGSNAFFKKEDVCIKGEMQGYDSLTDSGATITRYFCPHCGSGLFGKTTTHQHILAVGAGSLDNSQWFKPSVIVYNKRKPEWDFIDESIPSYEGMPPKQKKR